MKEFFKQFFKHKQTIFNVCVIVVMFYILSILFSKTDVFFVKEIINYENLKISSITEKIPVAEIRGGRISQIYIKAILDETTMVPGSTKFDITIQGNDGTPFQGIMNFPSNVKERIFYYYPNNALVDNKDYFVIKGSQVGLVIKSLKVIIIYTDIPFFLW